MEYLSRRDVAPDTWTFVLRHQVKAVSGVSAVPKKTQGRQRKLLMSCVTNYWWCDVRPRRDHGMGGGSALASMRVTEARAYFASLDEESAFSVLQIPEWMRPWFA